MIPGWYLKSPLGEYVDIYLAKATGNMKYDIDVSLIKDIIITQKSLQFIGDKILDIPFEEVTKYLHIGCLLCPDYTGVCSDISAGNIGDKTVFIVRNEGANTLLKDASSRGYIILSKTDKKNNRGNRDGSQKGNKQGFKTYC